MKRLNTPFPVLAVVLLVAPSLAGPKVLPSHRGATPHPLTTRQIAQMTLPSVVRLTVRDDSGNPSVLGSGFVVGPNLIVTNEHVVANAHAVSANFLNGQSVNVLGMINIDGGHDLALLYANLPGVKPLSLADSSSVQVGDPVVAIGSPEGYEGTVSTGIISAVRAQGSSRIIQTTAPISHGSSGGPLLNSNGQVVGVNSLMNTDGQALNFAYSVFYVRQLVATKLSKYATWDAIEQFEKQSPVTANVATTPAQTPPPSSSSGTEAYGPEQSQKIADLVNDYNSLLTREAQVVDPTLVDTNTGSNRREAEEAKRQEAEEWMKQLDAATAQRAEYLSKALSLYSQIKTNPYYIGESIVEDKRAIPGPVGISLSFVEAGYYNLRFIRLHNASDTQEALRVAKLDHQVEDYLTLVAVAGRGPGLFDEGGNDSITDNLPDPYGVYKKMRQHSDDNRATAMKIAWPLYQEIVTNPLFAEHYHLGERCFDSVHTPLAVMGTDAEGLTQIIHN